jgi:hypothetical protein
VFLTPHIRLSYTVSHWLYWSILLLQVHKSTTSTARLVVALPARAAIFLQIKWMQTIAAVVIRPAVRPSMEASIGWIQVAMIEAVISGG